MWKGRIRVLWKKRYYFLSAIVLVVILDTLNIFPILYVLMRALLPPPCSEFHFDISLSVSTALDRYENYTECMQGSLYAQILFRGTGHIVFDAVNGLGNRMLGNIKGSDLTVLLTLFTRTVVEPVTSYGDKFPTPYPVAVGTSAPRSPA